MKNLSISLTTLKRSMVGSYKFKHITYEPAISFIGIYSVQFNSVAQSCPTLCDPMNLSTSSLPVHHQLLEFSQTHVHWVGDIIQTSHPLSSHLLLPSIFPSIRVFSNGSALCIRWPKYWSFSFNISPSNEHPGPISLLKINENIYPYKDFYLNLQCSTKHNNPKLETIQSVIYPYNGILVSNKMNKL